MKRFYLVQGERLLENFRCDEYQQLTLVVLDLVAPENPVAMADAVTSILESRDLAENLRRNARKKAEKNIRVHFFIID